ncbi:MAG: endonuclease/exonuclease/phosphatase family protein [Thermomicrobiales bacterium]
MKVLSYNILNGGEERLPAIAAIVKREQPDAVALIEANSRANAAWLADELGMTMLFGEANCPYHIAWLSRLPIQRSENYRRPILAKTLFAIEVVWEGRPLRLFATHLASSHEAHPPVVEMPVILDVLRAFTDQPQLLVGDFNALRPGDPTGTPPSGVVKWGDAATAAPRAAIQLLLDAGYTDCYRMLHPQQPGYTYPTDLPWMRLDYAFASPRLAARLHACEIITGEQAVHASDHFPIAVEFR